MPQISITSLYGIWHIFFSLWSTVLRIVLRKKTSKRFSECLKQTVSINWNWNRPKYWKASGDSECSGQSPSDLAPTIWKSRVNCIDVSLHGKVRDGLAYLSQYRRTAGHLSVVTHKYVGFSFKPNTLSATQLWINCQQSMEEFIKCSVTCSHIHFVV